MTTMQSNFLTPLPPKPLTPNETKPLILKRLQSWVESFKHQRFLKKPKTKNASWDVWATFYELDQKLVFNNDRQDLFYKILSQHSFCLLSNPYQIDDDRYPNWPIRGFFQLEINAILTFFNSSTNTHASSPLNVSSESDIPESEFIFDRFIVSVERLLVLLILGYNLSPFFQGFSSEERDDFFLMLFSYKNKVKPPFVTLDCPELVEHLLSQKIISISCAFTLLGSHTEPSLSVTQWLFYRLKYPQLLRQYKLAQKQLWDNFPKKLKASD